MGIPQKTIGTAVCTVGLIGQWGSLKEGAAFLLWLFQQSGSAGVFSGSQQLIVSENGAIGMLVLFLV